MLFLGTTKTEPEFTVVLLHDKILPQECVEQMKYIGEESVLSNGLLMKLETSVCDRHWFHYTFTSLGILLQSHA